MIFSEATDIIFEPTVWIMLALALAADLRCRRRGPQTMVVSIRTWVPEVATVEQRLLGFALSVLERGNLPGADKSGIGDFRR